MTRTGSCGELVAADWLLQLSPAAACMLHAALAVPHAAAPLLRMCCTSRAAVPASTGAQRRAGGGGGRGRPSHLHFHAARRMRLIAGCPIPLLPSALLPACSQFPALLFSSRCSLLAFCAPPCCLSALLSVISCCNCSDKCNSVNRRTNTVQVRSSNMVKAAFGPLRCLREQQER